MQRIIGYAGCFLLLNANTGEERRLRLTAVDDQVEGGVVGALELALDEAAALPGFVWAALGGRRVGLKGETMKA